MENLPKENQIKIEPPKSRPVEKSIELKLVAQRLFTQMNPESPDDQIFFQELLLEFSNQLDVLDQLKKFHAWCLDQHPQRILNCRFRFRSWLGNAAEYQKNKKPTEPPHFYSSKRRISTQLPEN